MTVGQWQQGRVYGSYYAVPSREFYSYLFNQDLLCCSLPFCSRLAWLVDHRMEAGSLLEIYFQCDRDHQCSDRALDRKQKDQSILQTGMDDPDSDGLPVFRCYCLYVLFGKSRIAQAIQNKYTQVQEESLPYMEQDEQMLPRSLEEQSAGCGSAVQIYPSIFQFPCS